MSQGGQYHCRSTMLDDRSNTLLTVTGPALCHTPLGSRGFGALRDQRPNETVAIDAQREGILVGCEGWCGNQQHWCLLPPGTVGDALDMFSSGSTVICDRDVWAETGATHRVRAPVRDEVSPRSGVAPVSALNNGPIATGGANRRMFFDRLWLPTWTDETLPETLPYSDRWPR